LDLTGYYPTSALHTPPDPQVSPDTHEAPTPRPRGRPRKTPINPPSLPAVPESRSLPPAPPPRVVLSARKTGAARSSSASWPKHGPPRPAAAPPQRPRRAAAPSPGSLDVDLNPPKSRAFYKQVVDLYPRHPSKRPRQIDIRTRDPSRHLPHKYITLTPQFHLSSATPGPVGFEPPSVKKAREHPTWPLWDAAIKKEYAGLTSRGTWTVVPESSVPADTRIIPSKIVLKDKRTTGPKARLVVRGDLQQPYPPSSQTYAHTPSATEVRTFFALGTHRGWKFNSFDISQAFLQSDPLPPDASLYVRPPSDGSAELPPGHVWHLHKPLYGLAQAPRMWSSTFRKFLIGYGFSKVNCSDSFLTWSRGSSRMQLIVHVDDIVVSYNDPMAFNAFRSALLARFQGTDEGEPSTYLGLDLSITSTKTHLTQSTLARELLDRHGMSSCKPVQLPMEPGRHLLDSDRPDTPDPAMRQTYQEIVGSLQYLCTWTRPDLLFATNQLAKHMSNPGRVHMAAAHRVLRYLKGTADYGLTYSSNPSVPALLRAWADADWATCTDTRRSYSGAVFSLASTAVHWSSKQQTSVSTSTTEAEYVSASKAADDVLWLRRVLEDAGARQDLPTPLF